MLVVAVLVRVKLGKPVIFAQERPGREEKIFRLYKFRSMSDVRGEDGELLPDEKRLGRFGKTLRSTSLDELPELYNILKGDMSLVGPRPLLVSYLSPGLIIQSQIVHIQNPALFLCISHKFHPTVLFFLSPSCPPYSPHFFLSLITSPYPSPHFI